MRIFTRKRFLQIAGAAIAAQNFVRDARAIGDPDVTLAFPGDWQNISTDSCSYDASMNWILANRTSTFGTLTLNIKAVLAVGDCTNDGDNGGNATETNNVAAAYTLLGNAGMLFISPPGNHDYNGNAPGSRDAALCANFAPGGIFSPAVMAAMYGSGMSIVGGGGTAWWAGGYNTYGGSTAIRLQLGSRKFLIAALEFFPRGGVLSWLQGLHDTWTDHELIVVTHGYLNDSGVQTTRGNNTNATNIWGPDAYGMGAFPASAAASEMWTGSGTWGGFTALTRLQAIVCGHWRNQQGPDGGWWWARTPITSTSSRAQTVQQCFINCQDIDGVFCSGNVPSPSGGAALLLLHFRNSLGTVEGYSVRANNGLWMGPYNSGQLNTPFYSATPIQLFSVPMPQLNYLFPLPCVTTVG